MKDKASSVKVELPHNNLTRGGPIPHEQEYNTGHASGKLDAPMRVV